MNYQVGSVSSCSEHRALFSLQFPNPHCRVTKLPFCCCVQWEMALPRCLVHKTSEWPLRVPACFPSCLVTIAVGTLHISLWCTRSCSAFSQGPLSYWVVLCDICTHFWHRMAFANSFSVVDFCNSLSEILQAELSDMSL